MVARGDFSALAEAGRFYVDVPGVGRSVEFPIGEDIFRAPFQAAMLGFYGLRCGTALSFWYGASASATPPAISATDTSTTSASPASTRDGKGGWHDAGDFGKYTGNGAFTVGMMMSAWERHPGGIAQAPLPIPERGGALPDFLDEIRWELEWIVKMPTATVTAACRTS